MEAMSKIRQINRWTVAAAGACLLLIPLAQPFIAQADDSTSKEAEDTERKERLELMKRQAAEYEVTLNAAKTAKLVLHAEPLLRFSNPVGGVPDGIVVMWKEG